MTLKFKFKFKLKRTRGFFLVEIALAIILLGIIAAAVFPLLNLASRKESDNADRSALVQARESLLAYATRNGGFPGPLQLANVGGALSRTALADPVLAIAPDAGTYTPYGALPGSLLGTPTRSSKGTLFNYDVHPALRADLAFNFSDFLSAPALGFKDLHSPTNSTQGTGGSVGQLCRNVNTLIELERLMTLPINNASLTTTTRSMTLPRIWQTGVESAFKWVVDPDPYTGGGRFTAIDVSALLPWTQQRSSPSAFVVTRPQASAYARLDRANAVFKSDKPADIAATTTSSYRVYEHPTTGGQDSAVDDFRDYGGWSNAASLLELRTALQTAGQCTRPVDTCTNTELLVNFDNALTGQYYTAADVGGVVGVANGPPVGFSLFWAVNNNPDASAASAVQPAGAGDPTLLPLGDGQVQVYVARANVASGTVASNANASACVPVVRKDWSAVTSFEAPLYLHLFALLPDGKYWEVAKNQMMNSTDTVAVAAKTALNSGQSHAVTVKCFNGTPVRFNPQAPSSYDVPNGFGGVSCTATPN